MHIFIELTRANCLQDTAFQRYQCEYKWNKNKKKTKNLRHHSWFLDVNQRLDLLNLSVLCCQYDAFMSKQSEKKNKRKNRQLNMILLHRVPVDIISFQFHRQALKKTAIFASIVFSISVTEFVWHIRICFSTIT